MFSHRQLLVITVLLTSSCNYCIVSTCLLLSKYLMTTTTNKLSSFFTMISFLIKY